MDNKLLKSVQGVRYAQEDILQFNDSSHLLYVMQTKVKLLIYIICICLMCDLMGLNTDVK